MLLGQKTECKMTEGRTALNSAKHKIRPKVQWLQNENGGPRGPAPRFGCVRKGSIAYDWLGQIRSGKVGSIEKQAEKAFSVQSYIVMFFLVGSSCFGRSTFCHSAISHTIHNTMSD